MILKKSLMVASTLGAVALMAAGCSSTPKAGDDGGTGEGGTTTDGGSKDTGLKDGAEGGGSGCPTPADLSGYQPATLPDPSGKHQNKCDAPTLALYAKCVNGDMPSCMAINMGAMTMYKDCLACIFTNETDAKWGPARCADSMTCYLNIEGCVNLATGQTGAMSCGQLLHDLFGCDQAACGMQCLGDQQGYTKCATTARAGGCKKYLDAFNTKCGMISLDPDGGYPDLDNCQRRQTEMDSKQLEIRMVTYFCGQ